MTKEAVTVEVDVALVHEGKLYRRGDRLSMRKGDALDLQAIAFAHVVSEAESEVPERRDTGDGAKPPPAPRSSSRNRYLRRDRRDEAS